MVAIYDGLLRGRGRGFSVCWRIRVYDGLLGVGLRRGIGVNNGGLGLDSVDPLRGGRAWWNCRGALEVDYLGVLDYGGWWSRAVEFGRRRWALSDDWHFRGWGILEAGVGNSCLATNWLRSRSAWWPRIADDPQSQNGCQCNRLTTSAVGNYTNNIKIYENINLKQQILF